MNRHINQKASSLARSVLGGSMFKASLNVMHIWLAAIPCLGSIRKKVVDVHLVSLLGLNS